MISLALAVAAGFSLASCGAPEHSGSAFCAQLGKELPAIAQPVTTSKEVSAMVHRYERLLARSPLTIESDMKILTDLLRQSANVDPTKQEEVQKIADAAYHANQSALNVRDWVKSTCAVDITTGMNITPMRQLVQATTTTVPATSVPATTAPTTPPTAAPAATTAP